MKSEYTEKKVADVQNLEKPRVLLNVCTHGSERVGLKVAKHFSKISPLRGSVTINVANKRALKNRKRFITHDLNRSFPGKRNGSHEERLAFALTPYIQAFDVVLDIHSTETGMDSTIIVTKLTERTRDLIRSSGLKRTIYMKATKHNALISGAKVGIGFECGKDKDPETLRQTIEGVSRVLGELQMLKRKRPVNPPVLYTAHRIYPKPKGAVSLPSIKNYRLVKKGAILSYNPASNAPIRAKRDFYPILFGNNSYETMFGFEATKEQL